MKIRVYDNEWDAEVYLSVKDAVVSEGQLIVIGHDDRAVAVWAPGSWLRVDYDYDGDA